MKKSTHMRGAIRASLALLTLIATTSFLFIPVLFIGLFKLIPNKTWQTLCTRAIDSIVTFWCGINNYYVDNVQKLDMQVTGLEGISKKEWYLVLANHQSWLDIVILQRVFNKKIPVLKFFIKDSLKWVPLLGFSWWAMGCPFMKRYSREYLAKNPHKKGRDILSTNKAIATFKRSPASIMNFVEGTRFTLCKKAQQSSPYSHLLKPKAGGISFIINAMGQQINSLLDVTIVYPEKNHSLWDFLCHRVKSVTINVRTIPIPNQFTSGQLIDDPHTQNEFKNWLNQHWFEKDQLIASLKNAPV